MAQRRRSKQVAIRVTAEEYDMIMNKVEASGLTQQDFFLKAIQGAEIQSTDGLKAVAAELKELTTNMRRIGVNLNQIAKELNGKGYSDYDLVTRNLKEVESIWELLRAFIAKLL